MTKVITTPPKGFTQESSIKRDWLNISRENAWVAERDNRDISTRYRLPNEAFDTIGAGHYLDDEESYKSLASTLGIKDRFNLTKTDQRILFNHDFNVRRKEIGKRYPNASKAILDIVANSKMQYSPKGFHKNYGQYLERNDIASILSNLTKEGERLKKRGSPGVVERNKNISQNVTDYVKDIQTKLKDEGFYKGEIDGKFGTQSREATKEYQKKKGLQSDGIIGKNTWGELISLFDVFGVSEASAAEPEKSFIVDVPEGFEQVDTSAEGAETFKGESKSVGEVLSSILSSIPFDLVAAAPGGFVPLATTALTRLFTTDKKLKDNIVKSFKRGVINSQINHAVFKAWEGEYDFDKVRHLVEDQRKVLEADPIEADGLIAQGLYGVASTAPDFASGMIKGAGTGAALGLGAAAITAGLDPTDIVTIPAFYAVGQSIGSYEHWRKTITGGVYSDLKMQDIPDDIARPVAGIAGGLSAAIEFSQMNKLIPGSDKMTRKLISDSLTATIGKLAAKYGATWAAEVGEEGLQAIVETSATEIAESIAGKQNEDKVEIIKKVLLAGGNAAVDSMMTMGMLMIPGAGVEVSRVPAIQKAKSDVRKEITKKLLNEIRSEQETKDVPRETTADPLVEEAKKAIAEGKSVEEFVESQSAKQEEGDITQLKKELKDINAEIKGNKVILYRGGDVSKEELKKLRYNDYFSLVREGTDAVGNEGASGYGENVIRIEVPIKDIKITNGEIQYIGKSEFLERGKYPLQIYKAYNDAYGSNYTSKEIDEQTNVRSVASQALVDGRDEFDSLMAQYTKGNPTNQQLTKSQLTDIYNKAKGEIEKAKGEIADSLEKPIKDVIITEEGLAAYGDEKNIIKASEDIQKGLDNVRGIRSVRGQEATPSKTPNQTFRKAIHGRVHLYGVQASSPKDIAELFSLVRNPAAEVIQAIIIKDGKVVSSRYLTSGLASVVTVEDNKWLDNLYQEVDRLKADSFYIAHNHPGGNPTPSKPDLTFTEILGKNKKFKGHIVLNGKEFALILPDLSHTIESYTAVKGGESIRTPTGIVAEKDAARVFKSMLKEDKICVVSVSGDLSIISADYISKDVRNVNKAVQEVLNKNRTNKYFVVADYSLKSRVKVLPKGTADVILYKPDGQYYSYLENNDSIVSMGDVTSIIRTGEGEVQYSAGKKLREDIKSIKEKDIDEVGDKEFNDNWEKQKDIWIGNKDVKITLEIPAEKKKLQTKIKKVAGQRTYGQLSKDYDMAIQIAIDSQRNPQQVEDLYDELTDDQKKIVDLSRDLPEGLQEITDEIQGIYKEVGLDALDNEVIRNVLDNYTGRIWDLESKPSTETFRKFGKTTRHAKARVFDTIVEGWSKGYDLKVKGVTNNLAILKEEIYKTIADKQFMKNLMELKDVDGNPLLTAKHLEGYNKVEHPNFKQWKYAGQATPGEVYGKNTFVDDQGNLFEKVELYAPKKYAKNLNNILGISKLKGMKALDVITKYNAVLKAWILQTSLFHHMAFGRSYYLGTNRKTMKEMNVMDAVNEGNKAIDELDPVIVQGVRNGLTLGRKQDWNEDLLKEKTAIGDLLDKWEVSKNIKDKVLKLREEQADFLFGVVGSGLKAKAYAIEFRNQLREYPNQDTDKIAKRVAELINNDFGGLHLARLGRNPTTQHIFRLLALAPDWTESNIRTMVGAIKSGTKEETKMYRNFWAGIIAKGVTATILVNIAMAAFDEDDENGEGLLGRFVRNYRKAGVSGKYKWLDVDITPIYKMFGGSGEDRYYFSILGHFKDPLKLTIRNDKAKEDQVMSSFKLGNTRAMKYKASVVGGIFMDYLTGTDYAERRFTTGKEILGIDKEKGTYKTTRKGRYKQGDPKWGKLKGKTVTWDYGKSGAIELEQLPSFIINKIKNAQPVQFQQLMGYIAGEMDGFSAISNALGLGVRKTYGNKVKEISMAKWYRIPKEDKKRIKGRYYIKVSGLWKEVLLK